MNNHHNRSQELDTFHTIDLPPMCPTCRQTTNERDHASRTAALWQKRAEYWRAEGITQREHVKELRIIAWLYGLAWLTVTVLHIFN